jgi:hypothetical protein
VVDRALGEYTADRETGVTGTDHDGRDVLDGEPRGGRRSPARPLRP